jgi:RimJ/RimL family protein N-acetyltransferase
LILNFKCEQLAAKIMLFSYICPKNAQMKGSNFEKWRQNLRKKEQLHFFPPMSDSERLSFEIITDNNYSTLVSLFETDENPFIDERFKSFDQAKEYAEDLKDMLYDTKHGGCDFLIRLKNTPIYIGVLHLFDFSLETYRAQSCTLGFAIAAPFRRNRYATEAMQQLINYAHTHHNKKSFLVYTDKENLPSNAFVQNLNMILANEDYEYGDGTDNYYVLKA